MKMIHAVIRSSKVDEVARRLKSIGVSGCTVFPVRGYGDEWHLYEPLIHGGHHKLEIVVGNDQVDRVVKEVTEHAFTGLEGDGVLSVFDLGVRCGDSVKRRGNKLLADEEISSIGKGLEDFDTVLRPMSKTIIVYSQPG